MGEADEQCISLCKTLTSEESEFEGVSADHKKDDVIIGMPLCGE